jgi:hypothetical protein
MRVIIIPDEGMTAQARGFLQQAFKGEIPGKTPCEWCGGLHERECRRVKRMVYHPSGERVAEVEFWPDGSWDESAVIWPEDVFE